MPKVSKKGIPKDYICHVCGLGYTQPGTRNRHLKIKHGGEEHEPAPAAPAAPGGSLSANPAPPRPGPSKPKRDIQKVVEKIVVKKNSNMIRNEGRKEKKYFTTDRFPPCIFERKLSVFFEKRDEYLDSDEAVYDADMLWELRIRARNADLAGSSRNKKKIYKNELKLHIILLKEQSDLLRKKREFLCSELLMVRNAVEDIKCEIGKDLERNPSKALGRLEEMESLGISVDGIDSEMFNGLDSDSAHWLFDDL